MPWPALLFFGSAGFVFGRVHHDKGIPEIGFI
jgi:hypothetical protein